MDGQHALVDILCPMFLPAARAWQLPWLRLHLAARELLTVSPADPEWPEVKRALTSCRRRPTVPT